MKVSIITVSYNSGKTITDAIKSVLQQTYPNIEYIIVDGKSNDHTLSIIEKMQPLFKGRLHYIAEPDYGIYDAMNKGVRMATGDIIGILNSDDFFTSNDIIEKIVNNFTEDIDAIYGDIHFVKPNQLNKCVRYYSGRIFKPSMVRFGILPPHPSLYVKKEVLDKYGDYETKYKISADFELIARLCFKYKIRTRYLHLDMVTMRIGGASTNSWQSRKLGLKEDIIALRQLGIPHLSAQLWLKFPIKLLSSWIIRN